jgi:hypothetical protein
MARPAVAVTPNTDRALQCEPFSSGEKCHAVRPKLILRIADSGPVAPPLDNSLETRLAAAEQLRARPRFALQVEGPAEGGEFGPAAADRRASPADAQAAGTNKHRSPSVYFALSLVPLYRRRPCDRQARNDRSLAAGVPEIVVGRAQHAQLAVNMAGTMAIFLIETWLARAS